MLFIERDSDGKIVRVEHVSYPEATEQHEEVTPKSLSG